MKKGYHKMPDGSMMKNSDMKKKAVKKTTKKSVSRGLFGSKKGM